MLNVAHSVSLCQGVLFICLHYSIETVFYKECLKGFRKDFSCKSVVKIINYKKKDTLMDFSFSTPALLFSAISLFMMAHTNRFLALANLIRSQISLYESTKDEKLLPQINNFKIRLKVIKNSQITAILSFLLCVISMFCIFISQILIAKVAFGLSLVFLFVSLLLSLKELLLSVGALNVEMERIQNV